MSVVALTKAAMPVPSVVSCMCILTFYKSKPSVECSDGSCISHLNLSFYPSNTANCCCTPGQCKCSADCAGNCCKMTCKGCGCKLWGHVTSEESVLSGNV